MHILTNKLEKTSRHVSMSPTFKEALLSATAAKRSRGNVSRRDTLLSYDLL